VKDISYVAFILEGGVPEVASFPSKTTMYVIGVHFACKTWLKAGILNGQDTSCVKNSS
jgi:hypothetical protein